MENETTFLTKTGFCHILPDKIVLTRDGVIGNMAEVTVGSSISRILVIYGALSLALVYGATEELKKGHTTQVVLLALVVAYLVYGILTSLNNSATPVIDRQKIRNTRFKKAIPGLTRSRFEVFFEDEKGKLKKRLIFLPGSLSGGQDETGKAVKLMTEAGLLTR